MDIDEDDDEVEVHEVYRDGKVHILAEKCETCIFSKGRFVPPSRVRGMVDATREQDGSIIPCHSTLYRSDVRHAICRGFWDRYGRDDFVLRLAMAQGIVVEDPVPPKL